jgi:hypothetical protein
VQVSSGFRNLIRKTPSIFELSFGKVIISAGLLEMHTRSKPGRTSLNSRARLRAMSEETDPNILGFKAGTGTPSGSWYDPAVSTTKFS